MLWGGKVGDEGKERAKEAVLVNTGLLVADTSGEQDWVEDISVFRAQKEKVMMVMAFR